MKRHRLAAYVVGIALVATTTGCGDDGGGGGDGGGDFADQSAADIVKAAQEAMGELTSMHIEGDIASEGSDISMDLSLSTDGDCEGTLTLDGGGLEVLKVGEEAWFKADAAFWEAQAPEQAEQIIALTEGKWVVDDTKQYTSFCDLNGFLEEVVAEDDEEKKFEKGDTEDVDGQEAVTITDEESRAYIAVDEPHYILQIESSGEDEGSVSFSEFDEEVEAEAPAEDEIVSLQ